MKEGTKTSTFALRAGSDALDPLEDGVRQRVRAFIETILEEELQAALGRGRYEGAGEGVRGCRNGHRPAPRSAIMQGSTLDLIYPC